MKLTKLLPLSLAIVTFSAFANQSHTEVFSTSGFTNSYVKISSHHVVKLTNETDHHKTYHLYLEVCGNKCTHFKKKVTVDPHKTKKVDEYLALLTKYPTSGRYETNAYTAVTEDAAALSESKGFVDIYWQTK